jgi:hypothetical protein
MCGPATAPVHHLDFEPGPMVLQPFFLQPFTVNNRLLTTLCRTVSALAAVFLMPRAWLGRGNPIAMSHCVLANSLYSRHKLPASCWCRQLSDCSQTSLVCHDEPLIDGGRQLIAALLRAPHPSRMQGSCVTHREHARFELMTAESTSTSVRPGRSTYSQYAVRGPDRAST